MQSFFARTRGLYLAKVIKHASFDTKVFNGVNFSYYVPMTLRVRTSLRFSIADEAFFFFFFFFLLPGVFQLTKARLNGVQHEWASRVGEWESISREWQDELTSLRDLNQDLRFQVRDEPFLSVTTCTVSSIVSLYLSV
jgi:hypothetical protein